MSVSKCSDCGAVSVNMESGETVPALRDVDGAGTQCRVCGARRLTSGEVVTKACIVCGRLEHETVRQLTYPAASQVRGCLGAGL